MGRFSNASASSRCPRPPSESRGASIVAAGIVLLRGGEVPPHQEREGSLPGLDASRRPARVRRDGPRKRLCANSRRRPGSKPRSSASSMSSTSSARSSIHAHRFRRAADRRHASRRLGRCRSRVAPVGRSRQPWPLDRNGTRDPPGPGTVWQSGRWGAIIRPGRLARMAATRGNHARPDRTDAAGSSGLGPKPPRRRPASYQDRLYRLSEILGGLHAVRSVCNSGDSHWRDRMQELIRLERPSQDEKNGMVQHFNLGYAQANSKFDACNGYRPVLRGDLGPGRPGPRARPWRNGRRSDHALTAHCLALATKRR